MKNTYLDLMEKSLAAYSDEHIRRYFSTVQARGLTEHGFPRITANIGILIAHGRRRDLLPLFREMMTFCCYNIPRVKAANDFSVREVVWCMEELEAAGMCAEEIAAWKGEMATVDPTKCYNVYAKTPTDNVRNWSLFTAVSEFARQKMGLCDSTAFIELQLACQMQWLEENGMYLDNEKSDVHQPIMYDLVSRALFGTLLQMGYRGTYYEKIDAALKHAGLCTLQMQSVNGEMAFGGRSNRFLHNEGWLCAVLEYEADRYAREGNFLLASRFKAAINRAVACTQRWLARSPVYHVKNRFPTETMHGCENYAYFDKYMITTASMFYLAYRNCNESVAPAAEERTPFTFRTSDHFHKLFLGASDYTLEFDTNADPLYDAGGLGRVARLGAPDALCLSLPCPARPNYTVDLPPMALSLAPAWEREGKWLLGGDEGVSHEVESHGTKGDVAHAAVRCRFPRGGAVLGEYAVSKDGVDIRITGEGKLGFSLPAFAFDGEQETEIIPSQNELCVIYGGWRCRYTVANGSIRSLEQTAANRCGHYRAFLAEGEQTLFVHIALEPLS